MVRLCQWCICQNSNKMLEITLRNNILCVRRSYASTRFFSSSAVYYAINRLYSVNLERHSRSISMWRSIRRLGENILAAGEVKRPENIKTVPFTFICSLSIYGITRNQQTNSTQYMTSYCHFTDKLITDKSYKLFHHQMDTWLSLWKENLNITNKFNFLEPDKWIQFL